MFGETLVFDRTNNQDGKPTQSLAAIEKAKNEAASAEVAQNDTSPASPANQ